MGEITGISWTDHTFNPVFGCTKVSPGCDNCYAEAFDKRYGGDHWGRGMPRREFGDKHWNEPLKWDRAAKAAGVKAKVFCASMADVMDDEWPIGARPRLWELIDKTPNLIWQLLTKRPHRYEHFLPQQFAHSNVWLGTTAENQEFYDVRWPILRRLSASYSVPVWISYEPALGPLTMLKDGNPIGGGTPDWIIFGGESGNGRRPMERKWADDLLAECNTWGTKFFMKQFGARTPTEGKKLIPPELLIQEFPA
jgi:protein gp37